MADTALPPDITVQPEEAFWGAVPKIKELKELTDISGIIEVIQDMTEEEREVVFAPHIGTDMARMLVEMAYSIEADRPTDEQDWDNILRLLSQIKSVGELSGAEVLSWAALRTEAMVLADFQDNSQGALSILDVDYTGVNKGFRFLLSYTQACILQSHSETQPAFEKFDEALSFSVEDVFPFLLSDALGRGMIAASMVSRFDTAVVWGAKSLHRGTNEVGVGPYEKIEMLGELAWAHWSAGNQKKACGAMFGAVTSLISGGQFDTVRHKETLGKLGHVLGWVSRMALRGTPPENISGGGPYIAPNPGMIFKRNVQIADLDMSTRLHYLPSQLAMMATGVGVPRLAVTACQTAAELGRARGYLVFAASMILETAPIEAYLGNFAKALEAISTGTKSIPMIRRYANTALDSLDDPEDHWLSLDVSEKISVESFHMYYEALLPAFTTMVAKGTDSSTALGTLRDLDSAIKRMGSRLL